MPFKPQPGCTGCSVKANSAEEEKQEEEEEQEEPEEEEQERESAKLLSADQAARLTKHENSVQRGIKSGQSRRFHSYTEALYHLGHSVSKASDMGGIVRAPGRTCPASCRQP